MLELWLNLLTSDAAEISTYMSIGAVLLMLWKSLLARLKRIERKINRGFDNNEANHKSTRYVLSKVDRRTSNKTRPVRPYWLDDDDDTTNVTAIRATARRRR